ncbi:hypothetical protein MGH68_14955 [Erysipelothrix sp. D19-032]
MQTPETTDDHTLNSATITLTSGAVSSTDATNLNKPVGQTPIVLTAVVVKSQSCKQQHTMVWVPVDELVRR